MYLFRISFSYAWQIKWKIRSNGKLEQYMANLNTNFDIIGISETWLSDLNQNIYQLDGYNHESLVRPDRTHGGVSMFISSLIPYRVLNEISIVVKDIECLFIEIELNGFKIYNGIIYRTPDSDVRFFCDHLMNPIMSRLRAGQPMTSTFCWLKKAAASRALWGRALSWMYTKLCPNTPIAHGNIWFLRIWMHLCRFMAPSTTTSSLPPPPPPPPPPMVDCIAPHTMTYGPRFPSLGWTQASISLSPCLWHTRTRPSLWYREKRDSSLKIQCLHCLRCHTLVPRPPLTAASPVLQSEPRTTGWTPRPISSSQKPSPNGSNRHPTPNSVDHLPSQTSRDEAVRSDHSLQLTVVPLHGNFHWTIHDSSYVIAQSLSCIAKFCLCILETPPAPWLLLPGNCHLQATWQFAAVFAPANFVAWSSLKFQRNINSLYRNPTLHKSIKLVMAR